MQIYSFLRLDVQNGIEKMLEENPEMVSIPKKDKYSKEEKKEISKSVTAFINRNNNCESMRGLIEKALRKGYVN